MRNMINSVMTCFVAIALIAAPLDAYAQPRGGGGGGASRSSSSASSSRGGSSSMGRSSSPSMGSRSSGPSSSMGRSSAPSSSMGRSSAPQTRSSAPQTRSSASSRSSQNRNSAATAPSTRSQGLSPSVGNQSRNSASVPQRSSSSASRQGASTPQRNSSSVSRQGTTPRSNSGVSADRSSARSQAQPATRSGASAPSASRSVEQGARPANVVPRGNGSNYMRVDTRRDVHRVTPRMREPIAHTIVHHCYTPHHHYFGHRIMVLPVGYHHFHHWGIDYYICDGIYYRMWNDMYYVCRPPIGTFFDYALADLAFTAVNFAFYNNVYRTYNQIDENYATIEAQNRTIAENNALIAQQNNQIALNTTRANSSYTLANGLGLFQSYANANQQYYYNDGVFYILNANNQYEVIVPPAGALVEELPDDYDLITINGVEYYLVDTTVYKSTIIDGAPKLEVLGQMSQADADRYHQMAGNSSEATLM